MKKTLYYVVEKELTDIGDDVEGTTGIKTLTVYSIENNKPEKEFDLEVENCDNSKEAIKEYLEDNGMGDDEFELIQL